jgi:hypothetical protein
MMNINQNMWRDQQLSGFAGLDNADSLLLTQEKIMLDHVTQYPDVVWKWLAPDTRFKQICQKQIQISDTDSTGVIMFNLDLQYVNTTKNLVDKIRQSIENVQHAYVGINRYQIATHDLDIELADDIGDCLDAIMTYCHPDFKRLHKFDHVDGNHMVYAHPMDCYVLCK